MYSNPPKASSPRQHAWDETYEYRHIGAEKSHPSGGFFADATRASGVRAALLQQF